MESSLLSDVKTWFNEAGWLANAFGIGMPLVGGFGLYLRYRTQLFGVSTFREIAEKRINSIWNDNAAKSFANIAIVDDNISDFPVAELKRAGYRVKAYRQVGLSDFLSLAEYDVVFLDMHGIVKDDLDEGGLKLIAKLRLTNPHQKICAVSSKTFDPTASMFFKQADDVQKKPINAQRCQEVVDGLLAEKLAPMRLAAQLDESVKTLPTHKRRKLLREVQTLALRPEPRTLDAIEQAGLRLDVHTRPLVSDFVRVLHYASK